MSAYDDLPLDREFVSGARTISDEDVAAFARLTGDASALHLDDRAAAAAGFVRRIAHGMLIVSCSIGLAVQMDFLDDALIAFVGVDNLRFTAPVFIGDTITVRKRTIEKRPVGGGRGLVSFDTRVFNQNGDVVVAYVDKYLVRR